MEPDDSLLAVVAHGLLNSMGVVHAGAVTLADRWHDLDDATRQSLLDRIVQQSTHVTGVLKDLVRSGDPEIVAALDDLRSESGAASD